MLACSIVSLVLVQYSVMIVTIGSWIVAFLADGRIARWRDEGTDKTITIDRETAALAKVATCITHSTALIMTPNYRYLYSQSVKRGFRDITDTVCEVMGLRLAELMDSIIEMRAGEDVVVFRTEDRIGIIVFVYDSQTKEDTLHHMSYSFPSRINLLWYQSNSGFIRTDDNKLYALGEHNFNDDGSVYWSSSRELDFHDARSIREIVSTWFYTTFLMTNGSMYGCVVTTDRPFDSKFLKLIDIPQSESIIKIVGDPGRTICITSDGACYFSHRFSRPAHVRVLKGRFVTNAFILDDHIIVQYDTGRLCSLEIIERPFGLAPARLGLPVCMPFFDDKNIASIIEGYCIYFVSSRGQIYWSNNINSLGGEPIPFFNSNPVAADVSCVIPSALSMLE